MTTDVDELLNRDATMRDYSKTYELPLRLNNGVLESDLPDEPIAEENLERLNITPDQEAPETPQEELSFFDYLKDVAVNVGDAPNMLARGGLSALGEMAYSANLIDKEQANSFRELLKASGEIAEGEGVNPIVRGLGEGLSQFGAGMFGPFKIMRAAGVARPIAALIAEGISGAFAFNPDDPNLGQFINSFEGRPEWLGAMADFIETDPNDTEAENRFRNVLQDVVPSGIIEGIIKIVSKARSMDADTLVQAGKEAEQRLASQMQGNTLSANPVGAIGDTMVAGTGKVASKFSDTPEVSRGIGTTEIRSEGGILFSEEIGKNNVRLHKKRIEEIETKGKVYPGQPKNQRTVIKAPAGSGLPDLTVGDIRPEDWQSRIEATMSQDKIIKTSQWYKKVFGEFQKQADGDPEEIARLTDAWFAGQQNSSPSQTLNDVLFVYEQVKAGVPKNQIKGKGLPSANKIVIDILTQSKITGGAGQKISDFIDSGYGKNVRSIMNNDPDGGAPFVVDVHTARDMGLVDAPYINHMKELGYDVPDNIVIDFGGGGIKGAMYENRAMFGAELTNHLNSINWMGKSDWEPAEIQAIGWMQLSEMYGTPNTGGDIVDAFAKNTRRISMEVDPGAGSPWATKFGDDYANLDEVSRISINDEVTAKAIDLVGKRNGVSLGNVVHGTGGWELFQNPSTVQQAIASKDTAIKVGAELGYLLNQTEVWINAPKSITANPKNFAVDIIAEGNNDLRDTERLKELFNAITEAEPNELFRGYQPIIIDGKAGIKIIIDYDAIKNSPLTVKQAQEYILNFANKELSDITDRLGFDAQVDIMEADLTKLRNDWTKDQSGGNYKSYFSGQARKDERSEAELLDPDRSELENLFSRLINEAKQKKGNGKKINLEATPPPVEGGG